AGPAFSTVPVVTHHIVCRDGVGWLRRRRKQLQCKLPGESRRRSERDRYLQIVQMALELVASQNAEIFMRRSQNQVVEIRAEDAEHLLPVLVSAAAKEQHPLPGRHRC